MQIYVCKKSGPSRAIVGPGETFSRSRSKDKIFGFFLKWRILVYCIFSSDGGRPKRRRARDSLPPYRPFPTVKL